MNRSYRGTALFIAVVLAEACSSPAPTAGSPHRDPANATPNPEPPAPVPAASEDEAELRTVLGLPPSARLVHLRSDPATGGMFGREGLRVVAELEIPSAELATFLAAAAARPRWTPTLPASVSGMRQGPTEIPASARVSLAYCETATWVSGTTFSAQACDPLPARYDRYRVAVIDGISGRVHVVFKNYY